MAILDQLPAGNSRAELEERDDQLVEAVRTGNAQFQWYPLRIADKQGNTLIVWAMNDALKVEGVRINVSATAEQRIADILGALIMTPYLADVVYSLATVKIAPTPQPITASTKAMIEHSDRVDKRIGGRKGLVADCGKDWVLTNRLLTGTKDIPAGTLAANYGWHVKTNPWGGLATERSVDGTGYVIQGVGYRHDRSHVDYSQVCRLVSRTCFWNQDQKDLRALYTDPPLAKFVSSEGVLKLVRQPGVTEEPMGQIVAQNFPQSPANEELGLPIRYV